MREREKEREDGGVKADSAETAEKQEKSKLSNIETDGETKTERKEIVLPAKMRDQ